MENSLIKNDLMSVNNSEKNWDKNSLLVEITDISINILDIYEKISNVIDEYKRSIKKNSICKPNEYDIFYEKIENYYNQIKEIIIDVINRSSIAPDDEKPIEIKELSEILETCRKIFKGYKVLYGRLIGREVDEYEYELERLHHKKDLEIMRRMLGELPET